MYMQNRSRLIDIENQILVTKEEREEGRCKLGVWKQDIQTTMYRINKQQGYII